MTPGRGVTLLFSVETDSFYGFELELPVRGISMLCENILFLAPRRWAWACDASSPS